MHFDGGKEDENGRGFCEVFFDSLTVTMVSMLVCGSVGYDTGIQRNLKMSSNKSASLQHRTQSRTIRGATHHFRLQFTAFEL